MKTVFYVQLGCRTHKGFENFARFELGCDREFAYSLFGQLDGTTDTRETDSLTIELIETKGGLPYNLKIISCTLDQLGANCRRLSKEIFKKKILP